MRLIFIRKKVIWGEAKHSHLGFSQGVISSLSTLQATGTEFLNNSPLILVQCPALWQKRSEKIIIRPLFPHCYQGGGRRELCVKQTWPLTPTAFSSKPRQRLSRPGSGNCILNTFLIKQSKLLHVVYSVFKWIFKMNKSFSFTFSLWSTWLDFCLQRRADFVSKWAIMLTDEHK